MGRSGGRYPLPGAFEAPSEVRTFLSLLKALKKSDRPLTLIILDNTRKLEKNQLVGKNQSLII